MYTIERASCSRYRLQYSFRHLKPFLPHHHRQTESCSRSKTSSRPPLPPFDIHQQLPRAFQRQHDLHKRHRYCPRTCPAGASSAPVLSSRVRPERVPRPASVFLISLQPRPSSSSPTTTHPPPLDSTICFFILLHWNVDIHSSQACHSFLPLSASSLTSLPPHFKSSATVTFRSLVFSR